MKRYTISCSLFALALTAGLCNAATSLYTGPVGAFNTDTWNSAANWDSGTGIVPSGTLDVEIQSGRTAWAVDLTPAYTGDLTLRSNATLGVAFNTTNNTTNALGTGIITMESGSIIIMRYGGNYTFNQSFTLTGAATFGLSSISDGQNTVRTFASAFSGAHPLILVGQNGNTASFDTSNGFSGLTANDGGSDN